MRKYLSKTFTFEAAHSLSMSNNLLNKKIHGHSFHVEISLVGKINENGMIIDFYEFNKLVKKIKKKLDHSYLNEIKNIGEPTLENIGQYIWNFILKEKYNLCRIEISRKTCNECFVIEK